MSVDERLGQIQADVAKIEWQKNGPSLVSLQKLAKALNVKAGRLLE